MKCKVYIPSLTPTPALAETGPATVNYAALAETGPATVNYVYDSDGQLTDATYGNFANSPGDEHYEFDANGNEKNNDQQVGTDNELQSDGTFTYGYDAEGNCTSRTRIDSSTPAADYSALYTWDDRNRLTDVTFEDNSGNVTSAVHYTYDVENRWIGETVTTYTTPGDLSTGSVASQRQFVYDGNQIVLSFDGNTNSSLTNRYLWGPAVDQLLRKSAATGGRRADDAASRCRRLGLDGQSRQRSRHGGLRPLDWRNVDCHA